MEEYIYSLPKLYKGLVLARPSKVCKSPYLADVRIFDEHDNIIEDNVMVHSPALGCCGLIAPNVYVLCSKSESTKNKSKYVIHQVCVENDREKGLGNPLVSTNSTNGLPNLLPLRR